jgi:HEAT repeat protein
MTAEREGLRRCAFLLLKRFRLPVFSLFNNRWMRGPGEPCASLLEFLHEAAQGEIEQQRAIEICIEALNSNSPALAEVAAAALEKFDIDSLRPHESALSALLSEWKAKGSWCVHCKKAVHSYSCKQCHIVPPSPRKKILTVLGKLNHFSFEELLKFTHEDDNGVQAAATSVLLDLAKCDPKIYELVLNAINQGAVSLLREFIKRAGQEIIHKGDSLRPLLSSPVDEVRAVIVGTLDSAWMSDKDRRIALLAATTDPSAVVRSAAARVLRTKSSETQGSF